MGVGTPLRRRPLELREHAVQRQSARSATLPRYPRCTFLRRQVEFGFFCDFVSETRKLAQATIHVLTRAEVGYATRLRFAAFLPCSPCKIRLGGWLNPLRGNSQWLSHAEVILELKLRPEFQETSQVVVICQDGHALALQLPTQLVEEGDHIVPCTRERIDFLHVGVTVPLLNELFHGVSHSGPVLRV